MVAVDDVGSVVRQSGTVVFADYAVEPLPYVAHFVVYGSERLVASCRHGRHE